MYTGLRLALKTAKILTQLNLREHPTYNRKIVCSSHTARPRDKKSQKPIDKRNGLWYNYHTERKEEHHGF